ncbi:hypothetical protein BGZ65_006423 [Modicella reniformis]|uniref:Uncharacterized protein n=1 Tax=Modicella reniformis TaxID=1440133 RepID=A0A9P6LY93_9FUNG|nr:hypothetical protein BGZ65_006423 [Modicella reniformis]
MPVALTARRYSDTLEVAMPTRDWVKMQTRVNALEMEIVHVTRTNELLNQELDKLNGHLRRLTSQEGEEWRKEYEFLVQQVDLMHRQLQRAHNQMGHGPKLGHGKLQHKQQAEGERGQFDMTRQLREEIKVLTASLKAWQGAFQQADEKYRRKREGERVLKQTLRDRETQLSGLNEKLAGYEELLCLSTDLDPRETQKQLTYGNVYSVSDETFTVIHADRQMPGIFHERPAQRPVAVVNAGQFSVPILTWATLLTAYMLA